MSENWIYSWQHCFCCTRGESGKETFPGRSHHWSSSGASWWTHLNSDARWLNAKEVLTLHHGMSEEWIFPFVDLFEDFQVTENIHLNLGQPILLEEKNKEICLGRTRQVVFFITHFPRLIAGWWWSKKWFLVHVPGNSLFTRHHVDPRVELYVHERSSHSQFHWNTSARDLGLQVRLWTVHACRKISTIIGTWMEF